MPDFNTAAQSEVFLGSVNGNMSGGPHDERRGDMGDYKPQITVEKGVIEGVITTAVAGVVVGFLPNADPAEVAATVGVVIALVKMARNWWKNRKGVPA